MRWIKEPVKKKKINKRCIDFLSKQNIKVPLILDMYGGEGEIKQVFINVNVKFIWANFITFYLTQF